MNSNRPQKHGLTALDGAMVLIVILLMYKSGYSPRLSNRIWPATVTRHCLGSSFPEFYSRPALRSIGSSTGSTPIFARDSIIALNPHRGREGQEP
jgi:hypothetical protein